MKKSKEKRPATLSADLQRNIKEKYHQHFPIKQIMIGLFFSLLFLANSSGYYYWWFSDHEAFSPPPASVLDEQIRPDIPDIDPSDVPDLQDPDDSVYYYSSILTGTEKESYDLILQGLLNQETKITIPVKDGFVGRSIYQCVFNDHPEIFWSGIYVTLYFNMDSTLDFIVPGYEKTPEEIAIQQKEIDTALARAEKELEGNDSEYEFAKAAYEYIAKTVKYDLDAEDNQNIYSSLVNRVSVCAGYAEAYVLLLQRHGIMAMAVMGDAGGPHEWVIARIDGSFYQIDPTWGDDDTFNIVDYDYFLRSDTFMMLQRVYDRNAVYPPKCPADYH